MIFNFFWKGKHDLVSCAVVVQPNCCSGFSDVPGTPVSASAVKSEPSVPTSGKRKPCPSAMAPSPTKSSPSKPSFWVASRCSNFAVGVAVGGWSSCRKRACVQLTC